MFAALPVELKKTLKKTVTNRVLRQKKKLFLAYFILRVHMGFLKNRHFGPVVVWLAIAKFT